MKTVYNITIVLVLFAVGTQNLYAQKWTGKKENGEAHGYGTMTYKNGNVFTGEMKDGKIVQGTYTYTNTTGSKCKYIGYFRRSSYEHIFEGFGELWLDSFYYVGYFWDDKPHGYGTLVMKKDGTTVSGLFQNWNFIEGFIADKDGKLTKIEKPEQ